jgi:CheY-like chemotaxis protein
MATELFILVAEDDQNDRVLLTHALTRDSLPVRVMMVGDGEETIDYLQGTGKYANRAAYPFPDLLLLDLKMPRLSGLDVLKWLRADPCCHALPVIIFSGSGLEKDVQQAYRLGANTYFQKQGDPRVLINLLRLVTQYWLASMRPRIPVEA